MKRATLSAYPTTTPTQPTDLTDRLLAHDDPAAVSKPARRRGGPPRPKRSRPVAEPTALVPENPEPPRAPAEPSSSLVTALAAADAAADALRNAGREAPARYDVALRYRLDALAYHLQQVKEFVASLAPR